MRTVSPTLCAQLLESFTDVRRGLREHRSDRRQRLELELRQCCGACSERSMRDRAEILCIHRRATDLLDRYGSGSRNRIDHHAFERPLPQFTDQQSDQEFLLVARGACEQGLQCLRTLGRRSRAT
jgi:hypothetical protein